MRVAALICLAAFGSVFAFGQKPDRQTGAAKENVFNNPDGTFTFQYPSQFRLCVKDSIGPCLHSYIPTCDREDALVCVAYEGANAKYTAGAFQVKIISDELRSAYARNTGDACVTPMPNPGDERFPEFLVSSEHPIERLGGVNFIHGVKGGVATGHVANDDIYRVFHSGKCYELRITLTQDDAPPTPVPAPDHKIVRQALLVVLRTFRFTSR